MKIVVAVKQVAALDEEFELVEDGVRVDADYLEWDLNEWDTFSIEAALQLRDDAGGDGHEVVVITVGDEEAEEGLSAAWPRAPTGPCVCGTRGSRAPMSWPWRARWPRRSGARRRIWSYAGCSPPTRSTARPEPQLAGYLDLPRVAVVTQLDWDAASGTATVHRELEGGLIEVLRIHSPALLTIQTGINEPRYATLRAIKQAREKPLEVVGLDELGLDDAAVQAAAGSRTVALAPPERGAGAEMLNGSPAAVAARIVEIVQERMSG